MQVRSDRIDERVVPVVCDLDRLPGPIDDTFNFIGEVFCPTEIAIFEIYGLAHQAVQFETESLSPVTGITCGLERHKHLWG